MEKRTRPNQLKIRLSDKELAQVREKFGQSRSKSMRHFVLKCILETSIYEIDMQPFREIQHLLSKTSTNINQIAKKVNTYSVVYKEDIVAIKNEVQHLSKELHNLQNTLYNRTNQGDI
ncbi:MobC family plasmid mobilization relaxosome protein [Streptococcus suis]|uniref:plasmid mobilization protein n=1 Tax=Streptococcus suis TaxID=1307 RepID=UPI001DA8CA60|nr:plasmid mobilization relaxosome protein MobC [Streptococcus suis]MBS8094463.1 MobC family plasmid mobilization relaxosome protein [Streptococcus suis]